MDTPFGSVGTLNGTTPVMLASAPASSAQRVILKDGAGIYNADSVTHSVSWMKNKNSTSYVLDTGTVTTGGVILLGKPVVLAAADESLEAVMGAAVGATAPTYDIAGMDTD